MAHYANNQPCRDAHVQPFVVAVYEGEAVRGADGEAEDAGEGEGLVEGVMGC